jgi:hypothetical protein
MARPNGAGLQNASDGVSQVHRTEVLRLSAMADVDGDPVTLGDAQDLADGGDAEYAWLMDGLAAGELLVVGIELTARIRRGDGTVGECSTRVRGAWVENGTVPFVELQISQHAAAGLDDLRSELVDTGVAVSSNWHDAAFIHVQLSRRLEHALTAGQAAVAALSARDATDRALEDPFLAAVEHSRRHLVEAAEDAGSVSHECGALLHLLVDERGQARSAAQH